MISLEKQMDQIAVVTGAGSGVGRAVAQRLAAEGWNVALLGRRAAALAETAASNPSHMAAFECDVSDSASVDRAFSAVRKQFGFISVLVNSAGINTPRRSWEQLSTADYLAVVNTNLNGVFYCVAAVLPEMRGKKRGTIVNIGSDAGLAASPKAGAAYVASKFGVTGLTQSINAEERANGIRACAIFPGDIDTPILENRPVPPSKEARQKMLRPSDVAECAWLAIRLGDHAIIEQLVIRPR
jgi:NAD(P)-dependent dehydrogenase (short-subunit alcohol dehydrogenase family)